MRWILLGVMLAGVMLAGCGADGGGGPTCEPVEGGAPCCEAPDPAAIECPPGTERKTATNDAGEIYAANCQTPAGEIAGPEVVFYQPGPGVRYVTTEGRTWECADHNGHVDRCQTRTPTLCPGASSRAPICWSSSGELIDCDRWRAE